jgi:hypothetical protein
MSDQPIIPPTKQQAVRQPYNPAAAGAGSNAMAAVSKKANEDWMSPIQVVLAALIAGVLLALVYYYTVTTLLQVSTVLTTGQNPVPILNPTNGIFGSSNWLTVGSGALFFLIVAVLLTSAGVTMGMSWKRNGDAAMWAIGSTVLVGILFYFVFASARDNRKDQFAFWSFLAAIVAVAVPGYGWWQTRALVKDVEANPGNYIAVYDGKDTEVERIKSRGTWAMITFGTSSLFALITAAGLYKIYGQL